MGGGSEKLELPNLSGFGSSSDKWLEGKCFTDGCGLFDITCVFELAL